MEVFTAGWERVGITTQPATHMTRSRASKLLRWLYSLRNIIYYTMVRLIELCVESWQVDDRWWSFRAWRKVTVNLTYYARLYSQKIVSVFHNFHRSFSRIQVSQVSGTVPYTPSLGHIQRLHALYLDITLLCQVVIAPRLKQLLALLCTPPSPLEVVIYCR